MRKFVKVALFCFLFSLASIVYVHAEVTLDIADQYIQRMQFYEKMNAGAAPVASTDAGTEYVNEANGSVTYKTTDLSLPGKNGMDLNITRSLNSAKEYEQLNIINKMNIYTASTNEKYVFQYYIDNDPARRVLIAFDSVQDMLQRENGTNMLSIGSGYAQYVHVVSHDIDHEEDYDIINLSWEYSDETNIGFGEGSSYYHINELPSGSDVALYRNLQKGFIQYGLITIHSYIHERDALLNTPEVNYWDLELPYMQYAPTIGSVTDGSGNPLNFYYGYLYEEDGGYYSPIYTCYNGYVMDEDDDAVSSLSGIFYNQPSTSGSRHLMVASGNKLTDTSSGIVYDICIPYAQRQNFEWEYVDRGMLYDTDTGMALDYKLEYETNRVGAISGHNGTVYNYKPKLDGTGEYKSEESDMYTLTCEQDYHYYDMLLTFNRYDGTSFNRTVFSSSTSAGKAYSPSGHYDISVMAFDQKTDKYGNSIVYEEGPYGWEFTDTYGRKICIDEDDGITVNGELVVSYSTETVNNDVVDPNDLIYEDSIEEVTVTNELTGRSVVYNERINANVYKLGSKGGVIPVDLTTAVYTSAIDSVVLPSGGEIHYEYSNGAFEDKPMQTYVKQSLAKVARRYEKIPNDAEAKNVMTYTYNHSSPTARVTTVRPAGQAHTLENTYNEKGYVTQKVKSSTESRNSYYFKTTYEYADTAEGNYLPETETVLVKTSSAAPDGSAQITVFDYEYNDCQQLTAKKQDGAYIEKNNYDGSYGIQTEAFKKQNDTTWVGTKNTLGSGGKNVSVSYAASKPSETASPVTHESTEYTYTSAGEIATFKSGGVTTEYSYAYGSFSEANPTVNSLTKTVTVKDVANITDANGDGSATQNLVTTEVYDWLGRKTSTTDAKNNTTAYEYDGLGRVTKQTNPDTTYAEIAYDDSQNIITTTAEDDAQQKFTYDPIGRNTAAYVYSAETEAWLKVYENNYDTHSRLLAKIVFNDDGTEKSRVTYTYFDDGQPKSETVFEAAQTLSKKEYAYSPYHSATEAAVSAKVYSSGSGYLTATKYIDKQGRRTKDTVAYDAIVNTQSYTTDLLGNILTVKDFKANAEGASAPTVSYVYDYANRAVQTVTMAGTVTKHIDSFGRTDMETDARGNSVYYTYNGAGAVTQVRQPMDSSAEAIVNQYYDKNGNLTREETKKEGSAFKTTKNIYDSRNRLSAVVAQDAAGNVITKYAYDNAGRITKQALGLNTVSEAIDPLQHKVTTYTYDSIGRMTASTDALGQTSAYQYNILGELLSETDRNGTVKSYTYDGLSRIRNLTAAKEGADDQSIAYIYDLMGNITQMVDSDGTTGYTYSKNGELLSETRNGVAKNYTYNANGSRLSFAVPSKGISVSYLYDALGRLTDVTDAGVTTHYTYDPNGNVLSEATGSDRTVTYLYNKANLLTDKTNKRGSQTLETYALTYYADGNVNSVTENGAAKSYTYDDIGRLTKETKADAITEYAYDKYNNRTAQQVYDGSMDLQSSTAYVYDKNNRLTKETVTGGAAQLHTFYNYDANGNQISKLTNAVADTASGSAALSLDAPQTEAVLNTYDLLNRLKTAEINKNGARTTASYAYDGTGLRTSKTVNGVTTSFVLDGMNVVYETTSGSSTYYSRGLGLISRKSGAATDYYYTNSHGDVTKLVSSGGSVIVDYSYDAFGNQNSETGDMNPFRYCGEYFDSESGSIYLRARYYDPGTGRFISEDPIKDGLNWYVYVSNNPVNKWDPTGLLDEYVERYNQDGFKVYSYWDGEKTVYAYEGDIGSAYDKNPSAQQVKNYIIFQSIQSGVPISISLAVGRTESGFTQVMPSDSNFNGSDYGVMQINKGNFDKGSDTNVNGEDVVNDWQANVRQGVSIVKNCYLVAVRNNEGSNGPHGYFENIAAATYSAYNAGPGNYYRYRNPRQRAIGDDYRGWWLERLYDGNGNPRGDGYDDRDQAFLINFRNARAWYGW